jgi:hypothetical protein
MTRDEVEKNSLFKNKKIKTKSDIKIKYKKMLKDKIKKYN